MVRKDFFIGQRLEIPKEFLDYQLIEWDANELGYCLIVTGIHDTLDIVHIKLKINWGGHIHSGINFKDAKEWFGKIPNII